MIGNRWWLLVLAASGSGLGAQARPLTVAASSGTQLNGLTAAERAAGWRLLFDGRTLAGWRGLGYDSVPTAHWRVEAGTIKNTGSITLIGSYTYYPPSFNCHPNWIGNGRKNHFRGRFRRN